MPEHFRSRTDMIEWLIKNCPRPAIVRALETNKVEFLGGFIKVPPSNLPGWIFKVRNKNVCILANDKEHKYEIRIVKRVPWENWAGEEHGMLRTKPLMSGDNAVTYLVKKLWRLKNVAKSNRPTEDC